MTSVMGYGFQGQGQTSAVAPRYLSAYLASAAGQREVMGRNKQGVKAGLNFDDIRSFRVPLPPPDLQRGFLERAELVMGQVSKARDALKYTHALFAALQAQAFSVRPAAAKLAEPGSDYSKATHFPSC